MRAKLAGQLVLLNLSLFLIGNLVIAKPVSAEIVSGDESEGTPPTSKSRTTTTVYKVVNPDGSVSFSDQPQDRAQAIEVAPVTTVPAYKVMQNHALTPGSEPDSATTSYQTLAISSPADKSAFHSGSGDVQVAVDLNPSLSPGHALELLLDNKLIATQAGTQFQLSNVDRGTHTLTIKIIDPQKQVLQSSTSQFTVHRP